MDYVDAFVLIIGMIGWGTSIIILRQSFYWKKRHDDAVESWTIESKNKDDTILQLQDKVDFYEDNQRVIKIEQVHAEPREYCCKFPVHERFIDDTELFKKICISEVSRYMAEELDRDPMAYKLYFEKNAWSGDNTVKIKFRLLPYPEGLTNFDEIIEKTFKRQRRIENNEGH